MKVKEIVEQTGLSKDTLRYYEREGIISPPQRGENGYRNYTKQHVRQLNFIRYAQSVGFTLGQIKQAIPFVEKGDPNCPTLQKAIREQVEAIDKKIAELNQAKQTLTKWIT